MGRPRNGKGQQFPRENPGVSIVVKLHEKDMDDLIAVGVKEERSTAAQARFFIKEGLAKYKSTGDV